MTHCLLVLTLTAWPFVTASAQSTPRAVADELLAADRAFAAAAKDQDIIPGLSSMFAPDVIATIGTNIVSGASKVVETLKANPLNTGGSIEWTPARVSVSGDGRHGFTAGVMTVHRADQSTQPLKYLAYWEKRTDGWRVRVYKRGVAKQPAPAIEVSYVLPERIAAASADAGAIERYRESLADAERSFARDAQTMGIGPAFKQYGHPEAINLGGPNVATFLLGNDQISEGVGSGAPAGSSPVNWGPEKTIVAASGDFGVTIGYIVPNKPGPDGKTPPNQPFFTIWTRNSTSAPWKYIAE
jgi:ketosteroid isomerase-like protein